MRDPAFKLTRLQARRFLLAHHSLWPPRKLKGDSGILQLVQKVGAIQFDPINVVGRNPDLVLQSRIKGYRSDLLAKLLYEDRLLIDGWDKVASIFSTADWPYFKRHRDRMRAQHGEPSNPPMKIAEEVLQAIREDGPKSTIDFKREETIMWSWGVNTSLPRACLEILYAMGDVVIFDRVGTRRIFELADRALPESVVNTPDPNTSTEEYQDWHVLRRVGGLGMANSAAGDWWLGMSQVGTPQRRATASRLIKSGELAVVEIEHVPGRTFFMRTADLPTLDRIKRGRPPKARAALIAALDNLMWDRNMVRWIFDFNYVWEVYKPLAKRRYGYYVLPVLYGDRLIARMDPAFDRDRRELTINNWWWEDGVEVDDEMRSALVDCLKEFGGYLQAGRVVLGAEAKGRSSLDWIRSVYGA